MVIAAIARGFGFEALTVQERADLDPVTDWVGGDLDPPHLIDPKISSRASCWFEEAFGH